MDAVRPGRLRRARGTGQTGDGGMTPRLPAWRRYLRFWGSSARDDVGDEIQFHLDMRTREYVARGMDEPTARAAAERRLGDLTTAAEACIEIGRANERRARQADF